ncbi:MAG: DinB family protein [Gemmatimonadota bacterium]
MHPITLSALASFPGQLEAHYAAVPAGFRAWVPASWDGVPSERLSAIEQVCHVRDIEVEGYHVRIHRILSESNPVLASLDSEELAHERSYATADTSVAFAAIRQARTRTLEMLDGLTPREWSRTATFEGYGPLTLTSLVHFLCSHDQQHLAGLQWLLGKIDASVNAA